MATINLVLDTRRIKKDNTYPIVLRVRFKEKYFDISTGFSILKKQFDHKNSSIINDQAFTHQLEDLKQHYSIKLRQYLITNIECQNIGDLKEYMTNKQGNEITISQYWLEHIISLSIAGRFGGAKVYETSLNAIKNEINLDIPFTKFLYKDLVKLELSLYKRGMSPNGIGVYMRSFRAICNKAINQDLVSNDWYPFRKFKIKKEKTVPKVLSISQIKQYFNLNISPSNRLYKSWVIGKLIFMLRGINLKDLLLLTTNDNIGDRIVYKRSKTGKLYSLKVTADINDALKCFTSGDTMLGYFTMKELEAGNRFVLDYMQKRKVVNKHLQLIGEGLGYKIKLSTYVFRYSYANIAKQLGFSKDLIAEALGHEYGNSVTGIYLEQFDLKLVDNMNDHIINAVIIE